MQNDFLESFHYLKKYYVTEKIAWPNVNLNQILYTPCTFHKDG